MRAIVSAATRLGSTAALATLVILASGCDDLERMTERARPATPHERYEHTLQTAGLSETALGRAWRNAARHAIAVPTSVTLPFEETMYFAAGEARASAYRVVVRRGQRLVIAVGTAPASEARVFVDVFRTGSDALLHSVESVEIDSGNVSLIREADSDSSYVVRVQPELLESARVTLTLRSEPMLAFPLPNAGNKSVQSFWGASRDGGRRLHQGVDIFAARGTPVLAVATGVISHVGTSRLGGNVVFLRDRRGQNIYYAHLERQLVRGGERVKPGDTLGTVGTTGNAQGGAPHLHFGIYRRGQGAIDPYQFIRREDASPPALTADTSLFGGRARIAAASAEVRVAPSAKSDATGTLERGTPLDVEGASGPWLRVRTSDGLTGYVASSATESAKEPMRIVSAHKGDIIRERPDSIALVVDSLTAAVALPVIGQVDGFLLVRSASGATGWIQR